MVQLIVVVISIALSAALGAVGVFYIGGAVMDAKDRTIALQYVAQGSQIATAWKAWSKASGNKYLIDRNWYFDNSSDLVPKYLSELPNPATSTNPSPYHLTNWLPVKANIFIIYYYNGANAFGADPNIDSVFTYLDNTKQGNRICSQLAILSQGTNGAPKKLTGDPTNVINDASPRNNAQFDCMYFDANSNDVMDQSEFKIFIYRVF